MYIAAIVMCSVVSTQRSLRHRGEHECNACAPFPFLHFHSVPILECGNGQFFELTHTVTLPWCTCVQRVTNLILTINILPHSGLTHHYGAFSAMVRHYLPPFSLRVTSSKDTITTKWSVVVMLSLYFQFHYENLGPYITCVWLGN